MTLIEKIMDSEGFSGDIYKDHLGNDTTMYGTLLPFTKEEGILILRHRLDNMVRELDIVKPIVAELDDKRIDVLHEMAYQLGVPKLLMFKNMWKALEEHDYPWAAAEMLDSIWANQTPSRARRLSKIMQDS